ncbi:MAG: choice-of-anchor D domain-containing protein, partial [Betaproteobacteria bacterium]
TVNIAMSGTGTAPPVATLGASPVSLSFPTTTVGSTSSTQSVTISNTGTASATSFGMANGDATHFPVSGNTCGSSLAAGASCSLNVAYAANAAGTNNTALTFSYAGGTNVTVQLAGSGVAAPTANLATAPSSGSFGNVTVGQTSTALAVTLTNSGGAAAGGLSFNNSNATKFAVSGNSCGSALNAGASCAFSIAYAPTAAGADSATLTISASGGATVVMSLSGTGTVAAPQAGQLSLPAAITMADQQVGTTSAARSVTISNLGPGAVNVLSVVSNNGAEFAIGANGCGTVQANTACAFDLTFKPSAAGARAASITITSNGTNSPQILAVSGTGTAGAPPPPPVAQTVDVIEYFHAGFGHYFITYLADEITKLDNGTFAGWARTGKQFKAWTQPTADLSPVCRFFTTAFAPKSSHFYTPFAPECSVVKSNSVWSFEGLVFYTMQASVTGVCPANTVPVYRMYNNGQSGAPNHRYTTEMNVRAQMLAQGWIPEGAGTIGVIMCSPP